MDSLTHSALFWVVVGSAVVALFLWLAMLSSVEGRQRNEELDRLLSNGAADAASGGDTQARIRAVVDVPTEADRFRVLGDPEYGLFLDDDGAPISSVSGAA
jgi:hypothetical protein